MNDLKARVFAWQLIGRELEPHRAHQMAEEILAELDGEREVGAREFESLLERLAETYADILEPLYPRLFAAGLRYPPAVLGGATQISSKSLIREVDQGAPDLSSNSGALVSLAHIGDEATVEAFARWKRNPPPGADELCVPIEEYTEAAAWCLDEHDQKRELFARHCFALEIEEPLSDATEFDALPPCSWCASPLSELLHIDLTVPEMSWIGWPDPVLRVPVCPLCGYFVTAYARLNRHQPFQWWYDHQKWWRSDQSDLTGLVEENQSVLKTGNFEGGCSSHHVGARRASLWSRGFDDFDSLPQLGGYPMWINDWTFPPCPECARPMRFLAQISDGGGGLFYIHDCASCQTTATHYQIS